ncbi:MAG TPA: hypothetical protein VKZ84_00065, partial [Bacteriovoracaceae bacterium]|nr:hypothetical protein [Bacteriovoracaceae bacterium]
MLNWKNLFFFSLFFLSALWAVSSFITEPKPTIISETKSPSRIKVEKKVRNSRFPAAVQSLTIKESPAKASTPEVSNNRVSDNFSRINEDETLNDDSTLGKITSGVSVVSNNFFPEDVSQQSFLIPQVSTASEDQRSTQKINSSATSDWNYFNIGNVVSPPGLLSGEGAREPVSKKIVINHVGLVKGELIVQGKNLDTTTSVKLVDNQATLSLESLSKNNETLVARGLKTTKILVGKVYNLIISNAYGQTTYPIVVELSDKSITPQKFAPLSSSQDGYILKWSAAASSWIAAPVGGSSGGGGTGDLSILRGQGLLGNGSEILDGESIALDLGTGIGQIPFFDNDQTMNLSDNKLLFTDGTSEYFMSINGGKLNVTFNDGGVPTSLLELDNSSFMVNGHQVCLSNGNCDSSAGVSDITVSAPITKLGTENVSLGLNINSAFFDVDGTGLTLKNNSIGATQLAPMGASADGQVLKWDAANSRWQAGTDAGGISVEADPTVPAWAKSSFPTCTTSQLLHWDGTNLTCRSIDMPLDSDHLSDIRSDILVNNLTGSETDKSPTVNAVKNFFEPKITSSSNILMEQIRLMGSNVAYSTALRGSSSATNNLIFTLPSNYGSNNQVLATDGSGNLSWVTYGTGVSRVTVNAPLGISSFDSEPHIVFNYNPSIFTTEVFGPSLIGRLTLANNAITNDKISNSAAIAWSKINKTGAIATDIGAIPTSYIGIGPNKLVHSDNSGYVGIGTGFPLGPLHVVQSTADPVMITRSSANNNGAELKFLKSRGTHASPTSALQSDRLMGLYADGMVSPTTPSSNAGAIQILAAEDFSPGNNGTYMGFETTRIGTNTRERQLIIDHDGKVGVGLGNDKYPLRSLSIGKNDTGINWDGNNSLEFYVNNVEMFSIWANAVDDGGLWIGENVDIAASLKVETDLTVDGCITGSGGATLGTCPSD